MLGLVWLIEAAGEPAAASGSVDDVVTAKVVSVAVKEGELEKGQELEVRRAGEVVGRLRVRTTTGICEVVEGTAQKGDTFAVAPPREAVTAVAKTEPAAAVEAVTATVAPVSGPLKSILEAQGCLELATTAWAGLDPASHDRLKERYERAQAALPRLYPTARLLNSAGLEARVAETLRETGQRELADRIYPEEDQAGLVLAPSWPGYVDQSLLPGPYGELDPISTEAGVWGSPSRWGEPPGPPSFGGIVLSDREVSLGADGGALVRRDFAVDDLELTGELQVRGGEFIYLILRSGVLVKFYGQKAREQAGKVATKTGYDNLRVVDAVTRHEPIVNDAWQRFAVRLVGDRLTVRLNDETLLDTDIGTGIMGPVKEVPRQGHVGFGTYRASGSFRQVRLQALSHAGRRQLPRLSAGVRYVADGPPVRILELPTERFMTLTRHLVESWKPGQHGVENGTLSIRGASYSQFSAEGLEGTNFKVSGKLRATRRGSVWFRVHQYLLFGLEVAPAGKEEAARPYKVVHTSSSYRSPAEEFAGTPLAEGTDYAWELEYHEPIGVFRLDGKTIMRAVSPTDKAVETRGPVQFGIGAYVAQVEVSELVWQRLKPRAAGLTLSAATVEQLLTDGLGGVEAALGEIRAAALPEQEIAARVLAGERAPELADAADFTALGEQYRQQHDWPTYLALLAANYQRFADESEARALAEREYQLAKQKYDIALDTADIGDVGLDNVLRVGSRPGAWCHAGDRQHLWIFLPASNELLYYQARERRVERRFKLAQPIERLAARPESLLAVLENGSGLVKLDPATGKTLDTLIVPGAKITDLVLAPHTRQAWIGVNENATATDYTLAKFRVHALDAEALIATPTEAIGMFLAVDPLGRFLYGGFHVEPKPGMQFDPGSLPVLPVGGHIDHLITYRIQADGLLTQIADRPSPGVSGDAIVPDPRGYGVTWVGRGGYQFDFNPLLAGPRLVSLHPANLRTMVAAYQTGLNVTQFCFNPARAEAYAYNGVQVRRFAADGGRALDAIELPEGIARGAVSWLACTPDGRDLLVAYKGTPGGIYLHRLPPLTAGEQERDALPAEYAELTQDELAKAGAELLGGDRRELGKRLLDYVFRHYPYTPAGEAAAGPLLGLVEKRAIPTASELPLEPAELPADLAEAPTAAGLELPARGVPLYVEEPAEAPEEAAPADGDGDDDEEEGEALPERAPLEELIQTLDSFRELAKTYPDCWLLEAERQGADYGGEPAFLALVAEVALEAGRLATARACIGRVLELSANQGPHGLKGYSLLARVAAKEGDLKLEVAALEAALSLRPRSAYLHVRLGDAFERAGLPNRARHHWLVSQAIYPSQPELQAKLIGLGLLNQPPVPPTLTASELFRVTSPSVVLVRQPLGVGTGFFISREGLLLTNAHVIGDARDLTVTFNEAGGEEHKLAAHAIGVDPQGDLALLAVDLGELEVAALGIGGALDPTTGQSVIAIGNPGMGASVLTQTITEGLISNLNRRIGNQRFIQTSAAVNPGNSGGPLLDLRGAVLGMVTLKAQLENVGFAIPADTLREFVRRWADY